MRKPFKGPLAEPMKRADTAAETMEKVGLLADHYGVPSDRLGDPIALLHLVVCLAREVVPAFRPQTRGLKRTEAKDAEDVRLWLEAVTAYQRRVKKGRQPTGREIAAALARARGDNVQALYMRLRRAAKNPRVLGMVEDMLRDV